MELTPKQQSVELIRKASRLLLIARPSGNGDALGSLIGLGLALEKLGKEVVLFSPDPIPDSLQFLPQVDRVQHELAETRDLKISIDTKSCPIEKLGYRKDQNTGKLDILVTPQAGTIAPESIVITQNSFRFDLIVILDTPDLEQLGSLYDQHTQLFFETPSVSIDHHASNDYFGKVNWVDLTAAATSEILVSLIESLAQNNPLWDPDIATSLLTGLIWDTQSFQSESTTPKSLTVAAQLIALGGRQQEIIRSIFKTRPLSTLKLWGLILSGLRVDEDHRFVWAEVRADDLARTGAQSNEVGGLMDELVKNASGQDLAAILVEETNNKVSVLLHALQKHISVDGLAKKLGGAGGSNRALLNNIDGPWESARTRILTTIRSFQQGQASAPRP